MLQCWRDFSNKYRGISHMKDMMIDIEAERFNEWLEKITRMLSPSLNGSRPRTFITGSRRRLLIRLSGIMNMGCSWFP
jgi:hypothetical protein